MHSYGRAPRAPAHIPSQIPRAGQGNTRSRPQDNNSYGPNQRFESFEHGSDQCRSFYTTSNSNFNVGQSFHASSFRQPNTQGDDEAYATRLQEYLYNESLDESSPGRTGPSVTELEPGDLYYSHGDVQYNSNIQPEPYIVEEPETEDESRSLTGEDFTRRRREARSRQHSEPFEPEEIYAAQRRREAPRSPLHAWNSVDEDDIHNPQAQNPRQNFAALRHTRLNQSNTSSQDFGEHYGTKARGKRPYEEFQEPKVRPRQQSILYDRPTNGFRNEPPKPRRRRPVPELKHSTSGGPDLNPTEPSGEVVSKRARKAAKVLKENKDDTELGADGKPKGLVRHMLDGNSTIQWRDKDGEVWTLAVYHYQLRQKYIDQQDPQYLFDVARAKGNDPLDITTSHPLWQTWRLTRADGWQGLQAEVLYGFERRGFAVPGYTPGYLMDEGRVVLDTDNHPVIAWLELPLCLSSALDGSDIETVRRLNPNITMLDIRARMPPNTLTGPKKDKLTSLCGISALGNRTTRFRERNACPAWIERTGSDRLKNLVWSKMSEQQRGTNSTKGLEILTDLELAELKDETRGKFLERAGGRALPEEERNKRRAVAAQRLSKLRQEAEVHQDKFSQQGKRSYVVMIESDEEEPTNDAKRHKNTAKVPNDFVNPVMRQEPYVAEDNLGGGPSLPSYQQKTFLPNAPFRGSGYQPPISYQIGKRFPHESAVNLSATAGGFVGTSRPSLDFGDAAQSFLASYNPLPNVPTGPSSRKRCYGEGDSVDEKNVGSEPKRRELSPRPEFQPNPSLASPSTIQRRWIAQRRQERQSRPQAKAQQPPINHQEGFQDHPPFYAANHQSGVVQHNGTAGDGLTSVNNGQAEDPTGGQHEESIFHEDFVFDAIEDNGVDNEVDGGFDNGSDKGADNNASHFGTFDNNHNSGPDIESSHGDSQVHNQFQGFQDTPILEQDFSSVNTMNSGSNSENQILSSDSSLALGDSATDMETRQSISFLDDYLRTMRTQEMAAQREQELQNMSPYFDFAAASEVEGGRNTNLHSSPTQLQALDYRFVEPVTELDQYYISAALWYTRAQVKEYTGVKVTTSPWKTYRQQWEEVIAAFLDLWSLPDRPQLMNLEQWHWSFEDWPTPPISNERFDALFAILPDGAPVPRHFPADLYGLV